MQNHQHKGDMTVEEMHAMERQVKVERSEKIRKYVVEQFQEQPQEVPTSSTQAQRYQVTPGQEVLAKPKAPPPEVPLQEVPRVP